MAASAIIIAGSQCFGCIRCGRCCRRWHVALSPDEVTALKSVDLGPATPKKVVTRIGGHLYIAHRRNGDCVFLDPADSLCLLHKKLGPVAKPLGCLVYPLNLCSCLPDQVSCSVRMDCPAVQQNAGEPLDRQRCDIERYARRLNVSGECEEYLLDGLELDTAKAVVRQFLEFLDRPERLLPSLLARTLFESMERKEKLGAEFLNDEDLLNTVRESFWARSEKNVQEYWGPSMGPWGRAVFRAWLANYLRRDEDWMGPNPLRRLQRTAHIGLFSAGYGSAHRLSPEHPQVTLAAARLFRGRGATAPPVATQSGDAAAWECYWRLLRLRLETFQFFGVAYYGMHFFAGLRALLQTYPLVLAAARLHAAACGRNEPNATDVQYGCGTIDHSFGRSPLLRLKAMRSHEKYFSGEVFHRLVQTLGG